MSTQEIGVQELDAALARFRRLLDPEEVNARQPHAPQTVYTPWVVVWLLVYQRLHANASLESAVGELFRLAEHLPQNRRLTDATLSSNTGAYSQARSRLDPELTEGVAEHVFQTLMSGTPPSWEGQRVFILDGTTTALSSVEQLRQEFPPTKNQHGASAWPILHWVVAHELSSGCALRPEIGAKYGPQAVSEVTLARRLLARLPPHSVLLADRNFGVFACFYAAQCAGHNVVTRLTESRFRALVRRGLAVGPGRWQLAWKPSAQERRKYPELPTDACVSVELHETLAAGADGEPLTLWIATTLVTTGSRLAELYRQRQHVETEIRNVKVVLRMDELRGRSSAMLRKELAIGMVAYNLVIQIRRLAAQKVGVEPRRLSFTGSWSLVKAVLLQPNEWTTAEFVQKFEHVLRGCAQRKLPNRPGRSYPRQLLARSKKYPTRPRPPNREKPN